MGEDFGRTCWEDQRDRARKEGRREGREEERRDVVAWLAQVHDVMVRNDDLRQSAPWELSKALEAGEHIGAAAKEGK